MNSARSIVPGAEVGDRDAQLPLRLGQHRVAGRERGRDQLVDADVGALHALGQVLDRRRRAVDDVRLNLEAHARSCPADP